MMTFEELVDRMERQEERVLQLVKIIAATNKRMTELTNSLEELRKAQAY